MAAQLQQIILDTESMEVFLEAFAGHAAEVFSDTAELLCGITLKHGKRGATVASSSAEAKELDEVQYGYGAGPCLHTAMTGDVTLVADSRTDPRWPEYFDAIQDRGYYSVLAVPLIIGNDGGAALDLYAKEPDAFDEDMVRRVLDYAAEASATLRVAVQIAGYRQTNEDLRSAMQSRTAIDIAVGIVAGQNHCTQEQAFSILRRASGNQNIKLRSLAERVVESVTASKVRTHFSD
ncbi:GAF and ANTAR domain-containing protein [Arthrobacter gandavensis]|uniref:GAF and ANTAR domain-containing protein n=1 Tax=Arthrobacter gandavensis TaxID=169960 RepID=UPI001FE9A05B|nr:GAF and ANTAR domain-containing protein [Arthrobacter gandavensis]